MLRALQLQRLGPAALALVALLVAPSAASAQSPGDGPYAFAVKTLNAGLGPPPEALDRSTPQASLEAFLSLAGEETYQEAAHLLDLADLPPGAQPVQGPELARQLSFLLERKVPIVFDSIPDRPDGMETVGSSRDPLVGEPRRSFSIGRLELDRWPVSIRLARVAAEGEAPVWVFSRQSVEHVDALYAAHGPTRLERMMPDWLTAEARWGLLWWEFVALPIVLATALAGGYLVYRLLTVVAGGLRNAGLRLGLTRMRLPLVLLLVGIFLNVVVSGLFTFSAATGATVSTVFWTLIVLSAVFGAARVLDTIIDATSTRYLSAIDDPENTTAREWYTNLSATKRLGVITVLVIGLAVALSALDLFGSFGLSLLVAAGAATAIFGLASQAVLGNVLASLQLALAKPIRIGDAVYYDGHWAYVERINYTFVQLRGWDQKRYLVPVKHFVAEPFENWTREDPELVMPVVLTLDHTADVEALRRHFHDIATADPDWAQDAEPKVQVIAQDEDGIRVRFYCTAPDPTSAWNLHCRMRERLVAFLAATGPSLPRTRFGYVEDGDAAASERRYEPGFRDRTGEPKGAALKEAAG